MHDISTAKAVRVSVPASVAANIDGLKKSIASVLDRLGCPACCSGFDLRMELQREFTLRGKVSDAGRVGGFAGGRLNRQIPALRVGVSPEAVASIDGVFAAIDRIADLSGHSACATGCDIFFDLERIFVLDAKLNIEEQVMLVG